MHLILIRHGQSASNVKEAGHGEGATFRKLRVVDPPLSPLGEAQADALAAHLGAQLAATTAAGSGCGVRLACSTMVCALRTAAPLAAALGLQCEVWPGIPNPGAPVPPLVPSAQIFKWRLVFSSLFYIRKVKLF